MERIVGWVVGGGCGGQVHWCWSYPLLLSVCGRLLLLLLSVCGRPDCQPVGGATRPLCVASKPRPTASEQRVQMPVHVSVHVSVGLQWDGKGIAQGIVQGDWKKKEIYAGMCWHVLACAGMCWHVLACAGYMHVMGHGTGPSTCLMVRAKDALPKPDGRYLEVPGYALGCAGCGAPPAQG